MFVLIVQVQRELAAFYAYNHGYWDRRNQQGITTETNRIMTRHQKTLADVLDLLEAIKAEKQSSAEGEQL